MHEFVQVGDGQIPVCYHGLFEAVKYANPREEQNFHFAGFDFRIKCEPIGSDPKDFVNYRSGVLLLNAILPNPENGAYLSYHTFNEEFSYWNKKRSAAWLIAHWWEHFMHNCPCQVDDAKPSGFREAFIDTLLYLEA